MDSEEEMDSEGEALGAPSLVAPADAVPVDGSEVTFVWNPVEGAQTYRLQVASTAQFADPVLETEVGPEAAVTVGNQFPTDGRTLFWRVVAEAEGENAEKSFTEKSPVESFLSTTAAAAGLKAPSSDDEEPVTALARAARREATADTFDFEDQVEKEKERGVAYEGVAASQIMAVSASIIFVVLVAVAILFGWFGQVSQNQQAAAARQQEYQQIRQDELEAEQQLQGYGVVDQEEGGYRIPIDRAMDLIATEASQERQQSE
jgi:hypothetical protein